MKRTLIVLARITLFCLFLYNIHFFHSIFYHLKNMDWQGQPDNPEHRMKMNNFLKEKVKIAKGLRNEYSPDKYFSDFMKIKKKQKELSGPIWFGYNNALMHELITCMHNNVNAGHFSDCQVDKAREKYSKLIDPERFERRKNAKKINSKGFWLDFKNWILLVFLPWFWAFYLKNFILGFLYLWIRWEKEYNTFKIKNPFSFCIAVLLYPYVIGRLFVGWLRKSGRHLALEAELRTRKEKLFSLLSKNEVLKIRKFVKNNLGRKDWQRYLDSQGLVARRSFAQALVATLVLSLFSAVVFRLSAQTLPLKDLANCQIETGAKTNSPPIFEDHQKTVTDVFDDVCETFIFLFEPFERIFSKVFIKFVFRLFILTRKIEHIPVG